MGPKVNLRSFLWIFRVVFLVCTFPLLLESFSLQNLYWDVAPSCSPSSTCRLTRLRPRMTLDLFGVFPNKSVEESKSKRVESIPTGLTRILKQRRKETAKRDEIAKECSTFLRNSNYYSFLLPFLFTFIPLEITPIHSPPSNLSKTLTTPTRAVKVAKVLATTATPMSNEEEKANNNDKSPSPINSIAYTDKIYPQVHLEKIPSTWVQTETEVGSNINDRRRLVVFKDPTSEAAVLIAYTPIRPDYPALSAFGNIDAVTNVVIPDAPGVKSELIYRKERKDKYEFEYIFQPPGQEARHLFTTWSMIPGDVLVTYTGQCLQKNFQDSKDLESTLKQISESFFVENTKK